MLANLRGVLSLSAGTAVWLAVLSAHTAKNAPPARYDRLAPVAALAPRDAAIAEKVRDLVNEKLTAFIAAPQRADVAVFYRLGGFTPLWVDNAGASSRARAAIAYLATVDNEGLDPSDYRTPEISAASDPAALAEIELEFTAVVLKYARDAENGRIGFARVTADADYVRKTIKARVSLTRIAAGEDVAAVLASFNPPQQGYRALRAKLAELRGRRLADGGDGHSLSPEGALVGEPPSGALAATPSVFDAEDIVIANMERWRWMPRDLGADHVIVNIANFTLSLVHAEAPVFRTAVVVGAPDRPTPLISAVMTSITINPVWNIPPSIAEDEYLPALARDPDLARHVGLKIETRADGTLRLYQPPGDLNVLGRIRFNFPNKFLVYQHDTDDAELFGDELRASSHGCMRVENPFPYAAALLALVAPNDGYSEQRLRSLIGDNEVQIALPRPIPVHLTYQTAFVNDRGDLALKPDIYSLDARLIAALKRSRLAAAADRQAQ